METGVILKDSTGDGVRGQDVGNLRKDTSEGLVTSVDAIILTL